MKILLERIFKYGRKTYFNKLINFDEFRDKRVMQKSVQSVQLNKFL